MYWITRLLAFAHGIAGLAPLLFNIFGRGLLAGGPWWMPVNGISAAWLLVITVQLLIPMVWAAWFLVLAFRLWHPSPQLATQLRWTHFPVLLLGGWLCIWGFLAMHAAGRSTSAGGGLLSPIAMIPLLLGVPLVALAAASFLAANRIDRWHRNSARIA